MKRQLNEFPRKTRTLGIIKRSPFINDPVDLTADTSSLRTVTSGFPPVWVALGQCCYRYSRPRQASTDSLDVSVIPLRTRRK
jgi:hypothetical protein